MSHLSKVILITGILSSLTSNSAGTNVILPTGGKNPSCLMPTLNGNSKQVQFSLTNKKYLSEIGTKIAVSIMGSYEQPVLLLDVENLQKKPIQFQQYVIFHECAHHEMEHLSHWASEKIKRNKDINLETKADCRAIERLVKEMNYDDQDLKVITQSISAELGTSSNRKDANGNKVRKGLFKYYKTVEERNKDIMTCYKNAVKTLN